ncbi:MAG TPA: GntR family transcriptional regulator [Stellaceae bacterium]|nr:GntR family transcriptional regulator [Stellaceae bacterium]
MARSAVRHPPPTEESAESLTERAYRALEELIVTLQLAPGAVVSEAALAQRLGIGRTPIREALQLLARDKLVVIRPRRGIIVAEENLTTQLRLIELRREVERLLARAGARRATAEQRRRFNEIAHEMEQAARGDDDIGFMRLDRAFNLLMIEAARNEFAAGAMAQMHGLSRRFWYIHYRWVADLPLAAHLHAEVARAVAAGEAETAARASDRLIDYIDAFARATLEAGA